MKAKNIIIIVAIAVFCIAVIVASVCIMAPGNNSQQNTQGQATPTYKATPTAVATPTNEASPQPTAPDQIIGTQKSNPTTTYTTAPKPTYKPTQIPTPVPTQSVDDDNGIILPEDEWD